MADDFINHLKSNGQMKDNAISREGLMNLFLHITNLILNKRGHRNIHEWEYDYIKGDTMETGQVLCLHYWKGKHRKEKNHKVVELTDAERKMLRQLLWVMSMPEMPGTTRDWNTGAVISAEENETS